MYMYKRAWIEIEIGAAVGARARLWIPAPRANGHSLRAAQIEARAIHCTREPLFPLAGILVYTSALNTGRAELDAQVYRLLGAENLPPHNAFVLAVIRGACLILHLHHRAQQASAKIQRQPPAWCRARGPPFAAARECMKVWVLPQAAQIGRCSWLQ